MTDKAAKGDHGPRIDAVWDIETADWDRFVCGSVWTPDRGVEIFHDEDDLGVRLGSLRPGTQVWAHAGGKFDVLWWLDWARRKTGRPPDARVTMSGAAISSLAIKGGPVFRDSCRIIPMSLTKASAMFRAGATKDKLGLPCVCGKDCGGYCSISPSLPADQMKRLVDYLTADIESLRDTLNELLAYCERNGITVAGTLAGSTWKTAQLWCGIENAVWTHPEYNFIRRGYYGGRVEAPCTECDRIFRYDRTQAYPAAMCKPLPVGFHRGLAARPAGIAYGNGKPGFYEATVDVPEMLAPPLPCRHVKRVVYPWGRISGVWARDELKRAEECGARILNITRAVAWSEEQPLLRYYMEHCFSLREAADTPSLKLWLKLLANSLSGAFAQDPERDDIRIGDFVDDARFEQVGRYDWIWRRRMYHIPDRGHVHYAGTLTADARVELHREICHAADDWCYSDTDSVYASRELTRNVGAGLGLWKFEGTATDFECLAPKVYSYTEEGGTRHARAKGITEASENWEAIRDREPVAMEGGVESFLVAARGPALFQKRKRTRVMSAPTTWVGGRKRHMGTRTRAPHVNELKELPQ